MTKVIRLTESNLNEIICSVVKEMLNNNDDSYEDNEFTFSDTKEIGPGKHQQQVFYNGEFVGFLSTRERNPLAPIEEYYHIPDVDYGIDNNGFIDFKIFKDKEEEALSYTRENFNKIVYLIKNGDWD